MNSEQLIFDIIKKEKKKKKKSKQNSTHLQEICNSIEEVPDLIKFPSALSPISTFKSSLILFLKQNNYKLWLCLMLISLLSSIVAISAAFMSQWLLVLRMHYVQGNFFLLFTSSLLFANLSTHLCSKLSNSAEGSGIPELKSVFSGINYYQFLNLKTFFVKYLGIILIKSAGFSIGFEAAFVHLVAVIGENITRLSFFREVGIYKTLIKSSGIMITSEKS
jgi:H+/Cl- antiporter ClcA